MTLAHARNPRNHARISAASKSDSSIADGGTLHHRQLAAEAGLTQAEAQYRNTVIAAMQSVSDVLHAMYRDADVLAASVRAEMAATESLNIARQAARLGAVSYLSTLNAEQAYQQTTVAVAQARAGRLVDTVALFQALGGGWGNRTTAD
jgi:outer membrane protein TolC